MHRAQPQHLIHLIQWKSDAQLNYVVRIADIVVDVLIIIPTRPTAYYVLELLSYLISCKEFTFSWKFFWQNSSDSQHWCAVAPSFNIFMGFLVSILYPLYAANESLWCCAYISPFLHMTWREAGWCISRKVSVSCNWNDVHHRNHKLDFTYSEVSHVFSFCFLIPWIHFWKMHKMHKLWPHVWVS